jgi:lysyl-tRNA synthetase class 2
MPADWQPAATPAMLERRAGLLASLRVFMAARGVLEVETPLLSDYGNPDAHLRSLAAGTQYLHTSPEFAMKRLLAAGSGPIYQICKVFRAGESGRRHQPEFTLLEWYRPGFDHHRLMDEVDALLSDLGLKTAARETYARLFQTHTGLDPHATGESELAGVAQSLGLAAGGHDRADLLDFLFSHRVAPQLGRDRPCLVHDFPASQAALARLQPGPVPLAERFELFINGIEIANGYNELTDVSEQDSRFETENQRRRERGLPVMAPDPRLHAALAAGLPDCAGVALGVDRLLMVLTGAGSIHEVLAFPAY